MYIYENKQHEACIVIDGVIPKETPDFVLKLDVAERKLYVNGTAIDSAVPAEVVEDTSEDKVDETVPDIEEEEAEL